MGLSLDNTYEESLFSISKDKHITKWITKRH